MPAATNRRSWLASRRWASSCPQGCSKSAFSPNGPSWMNSREGQRKIAMPAETLVPFIAVFAATAILFFVGWFFIARLLAGRRELLERRMAGREDELPIVREDYVPNRQGPAPEGIDLS